MIAFSTPGISSAMVTAAGLCEVTADEAIQRIGYRAAGTLIPYRMLNGSPLIVNGRPFYRLRLQKPTNGGKYLSPAGSGCQLFIPPGLRALLAPGCVLGVVEGEKKALAASEAGFPTVGIGDISSACPRNAEGRPELLPDLAAIVSGKSALPSWHLLAMLTHP